jgi:hypothetical protein
VNLEHDPLADIIREMLLERTRDLDGPALAAFVDGWGSLMKLLERADLLLPDAPPEVHEIVERLRRRICESRDRVLDDEL